MEERRREVFKLYRRRWFILLSYGLLSIAVSQNIVSYVSVASILKEYYSIKPYYINSMMWVYVISLILFTLPFAYIQHRYEMAVVMKIAATLNLAGAVIRYFSISRNQELILLVGTLPSAIAFAGYAFIPLKLARNWFAEHQVGKTTSLCVGLDTSNAGLGMLMSTAIIKACHENDKHCNGTKKGLQIYATYQLVVASIAFIANITLVINRPPTPPSLKEKERLHQEESDREETDNMVEKNKSTKRPNKSFKQDLKSLFRNRQFLVILCMMSIGQTVEVVYQALLNQMMVIRFPNKEQYIGIIGCTSFLLSLFTNLSIGALIDRTKAYKQVSFGIFFFSGLNCVAWSILLMKSSRLVYPGAAYIMLMTVNTCYYTVGLAHASELMHPICSGIISMIIVIIGSVTIVIASFLSTFLLNTLGPVSVNILCLVMFICAILCTIVVKNKRQGEVEEQNILQKYAKTICMRSLTEDTSN